MEAIAINQAASELPSASLVVVVAVTSPTKTLRLADFDFD